MTRRLLSLALTVVILAVLILAGCGSTKTVTHLIPTPPAPSSIKAPAPAILQPAAGCLPGKSFMGCSVVAPAGQPRLSFGSAPSGGYFPDVSSFQGHPDWSAAKPHIVAAVAKLGEYVLDPDAAYNVAAFKRLGIPFGVYWFVRPTGCAHEGALIEQAARDLGGIKLIVLDEEVSGISGYGACLNGYVRAVTGRNAVDYGSAGNNEDAEARALDGWVADYGPSTAPSWAGRRPVAWQFTDGRLGFPIFIPGVGLGDVSVNLGMFSTAPANPWPKAPNVVRHFGRARARELSTLRTWHARGCRNPVRRAACRSTRSHELLLQGRIFAVATRNGRLKSGHRRWGRDSLGVRYGYFAVQLKAR